MEGLRWKGNHEIFCHSPPFGCSSVTSMSLSGRGGEETACQSMPFYDVQYGDLRQLFYAIVTLEHGVLIYSGVFGPLEPPKPIKLKPFLSQNAIEIRAMYLSPSFPKRRLFASSVDTSCHTQTSQKPFTVSLNSPTRRPWILQVITPNYGVCWWWFLGRGHIHETFLFN